MVPWYVTPSHGDHESGEEIIKLQEYALAVDQRTEKTALYAACVINCEVDIINLLYEADSNGKAIMATDITGSIPLHLACGHNDARCEVVKELIKTHQE